MSVLAQHPLPATQIQGKKIRVPPRISLGEITPNNVGTLRKLNSVLFPVAYSDKFYKDVLNPEGEAYCKLLFYQDLAVGNIICRLEASSTSDSVASTSKAVPQATPTAYKLYIMTLGVLAAYRKQGLGSQMVRQIIAAAEASHRPPVAEVYKIKPSEKEADKKKQSEKAVLPPPRPVVESLYLHVQVSNTEATAFWLSHGFKITSTIENYYRKIEPRAAHLLELSISGN